MKGAAGARQASPRTLAIAGGVIVLIILGVVLAIVLSKGSSSTGGGDGTGDGPTITIAKGTPTIGSSSNSSVLYAAETATLLKDVPQNGFVLGDPNAPVTLVEWIDLQCPVCQQFETTEVPTLVSKYVKTGKLKIEMKTWNIIDRNYPGNDDSLRGQKATIAAAAQNKAFTFAAVLYWNQPYQSEGTGWMTDQVISDVAGSVDGLDVQKFATVANSSSTMKTINEIDAYAKSRPATFTGTPTILLGKSTEQPKLFTTGLPNLTQLEAAIQALLPKK